jgi:hypothetical protein
MTGGKIGWGESITGEKCTDAVDTFEDRVKASFHKAVEASKNSVKASVDSRLVTIETSAKASGDSLQPYRLPSISYRPPSLPWKSKWMSS